MIGRCPRPCHSRLFVNIVIVVILDDIKTKQLQWYEHVQRMEEGGLPKEVMKWSPPGRRKRGRPRLTWAEGINGRRLEWQKQLEEGDNIIVKWAQEDVETLYNLLNKKIMVVIIMIVLAIIIIIITILKGTRYSHSHILLTPFSCTVSLHRSSLPSHDLTRHLFQDKSCCPYANRHGQLETKCSVPTLWRSVVVYSLSLGAFAKLETRLLLCHVSVRPHKTTRFPLDRFSWNLVFKYFFRKCSGKIEVYLKSDKNSEYFTWRCLHVFDNSLLSSSYNEKCFRQKL